MNPEYNNDDIDDALQDLRDQTGTLRRQAARASLITFVNFILSLGTLFVVLVVAPFGSNNPMNAVIAVVAILILTYALLALFSYDQRRKHADSIFQEISEELEWRLRPNYESSDFTRREESRDAPRLRSRIILREFISTTNLPFSQGRSGPATYALFNIVVSLASILSAVAVTAIRVEL